MKVNLVSYTQSIEGISCEEMIVKIARVSNPSNENNHATHSKLLNYCLLHGHWSPFEMCDMTVEIETSRGIAAQILRHRSFSFQEFSQRYSKVNGFEPIELRKQSEKNRQSSEEFIDPVIGEELASDIVNRKMNELFDLYNDLLSVGVAREQARFVLPLCTTTRLYMKGSVRSWLHYLKVRMDITTQLEHRQVANAVLPIFAELFPITSKMFSLNGEGEQ